ncbi:MAG: DNA polymerase III subunit delta [Gemmatimonadota bacterium]
MSLAAETGLERVLESGDFSGVFFFHGDASRLRNEAARRLIDAASESATRDFNLDVFSGSDVSAEALASSLSMPPMMASRRVVALFGAEALGTNSRKVVEGTLGSLPEDVTFVVTATIPNQSRAALYTKLKKAARCFEWSAPRPSEIPGWIMERATRQHRITVSPSAAQHIAAAVGSDLGLAEAELEKLATAGHTDVSEDVARRFVAGTSAVDRWTWLDRVATREYDTALNELPALLAESSESAVGLISALLDHHLCLVVAAEGGAAGVADALSEAGKQYIKWKARTFAAQARSWTADELDRAVRALARADRQAKSGLGELQVVRNLLLELKVGAKRCA